MYVQLKLPATVSAKEVSALTGLGRATVYEGLKRGDLPGVQIGKWWVISRKRIQDLLGCTDAEIAAAMDYVRPGHARR